MFSNFYRRILAACFSSKKSKENDLGPDLEKGLLDEEYENAEDYDITAEDIIAEETPSHTDPDSKQVVDDEDTILLDEESAEQQSHSFSYWMKKGLLKTSSYILAIAKSIASAGLSAFGAVAALDSVGEDFDIGTLRSGSPLSLGVGVLAASCNLTVCLLTRVRAILNLFNPSKTSSDSESKEASSKDTGCTKFFGIPSIVVAAAVAATVAGLTAFLGAETLWSALASILPAATPEAIGWTIEGLGALSSFVSFIAFKASATPKYVRKLIDFFRKKERILDDGTIKECRGWSATSTKQLVSTILIGALTATCYGILTSFQLDNALKKLGDIFPIFTKEWLQKAILFGGTSCSICTDAVFSQVAKLVELLNKKTAVPEVSQTQQQTHSLPLGKSIKLAALKTVALTDSFLYALGCYAGTLHTGIGKWLEQIFPKQIEGKIATHALGITSALSMFALSVAFTVNPMMKRKRETALAEQQEKMEPSEIIPENPTFSTTSSIMRATESGTHSNLPTPSSTQSHPSPHSANVSQFFTPISSADGIKPDLPEVGPEVCGAHDFS